MGERPLKHLVVVGNGLVAAGAAVTLAQFLKPYAVRITWLQAGEDDALGLEVGQPALREWLAMVDLPEREAMIRGQGLFTLGVRGQPSGGECFLPYGRHGIPASPASFEHEFFRAYKREEQNRFDEHFLATQMVRLGRFDFPVNDPRSVKSTLRYAMTLEKKGLGEWLTQCAQRLGVQCVSGELHEVSTDAPQGITQLRLADGRSLSGDFYFDATGDSARLLGQGLGVPWVKEAPLWSQVWTGEGAPSLECQPYTTLVQHAWGWERRADLQHSGTIEAWLTPAASLDAPVSAFTHRVDRSDTRTLVWGHRSRSWYQNCVALGRAAGQPGELLASEWHRACQSLLLWLELMPDTRVAAPLQAEFNRQDLSLFSAWRELHELLALSGDKDQRVMSESLHWRLQVFQAFGRLWPREQEPLPGEFQVALLLGLGWRPDSADRLLADAPVDAIIRKHQQIYNTPVSAAQRMPTLHDVIQRHCPAVV